jgi:Uma2 family endonuclease
LASSFSGCFGTFSVQNMAPMITQLSQLDPEGHYTYADYLSWRFADMVELIKGKLFILSPAPAERHQRICTTLAVEIGQFFKRKPCRVYFAPFDVRLFQKHPDNQTVTTVVQPDICVVCDTAKLDERGCLGAPDWIIEIVSPRTIKTDLNDKYNLYEENGVKEYWVAMPDANAINQYVLKDGRYEFIDTFTKSQHISPAVFPELSIDLRTVFE